MIRILKSYEWKGERVMSSHCVPLTPLPQRMLPQPCSQEYTTRFKSSSTIFISSQRPHFLTNATLHTFLYNHQVFKVTVHLPAETIIEYRSVFHQPLSSSSSPLKTTSYCFAFILESSAYTQFCKFAGYKFSYVICVCVCV